MSQLIKHDIPEKALALIQEVGADIVVGATYIKGTHVYMVTGAELSQSEKEVRIRYREAKDWEATEWGDESSMSLSSWQYDKPVRLHRSFADYRKEADMLLAGEINPSAYQDKNDSVNDEMALVGKASKEVLRHVQKELESKKQHAELVKAFVSYEMEKRKQALEQIRSQLGMVLKDFYKKIEKIERVIMSIELYLGVDEELHQIRKGECAPINTPISFRQQVLFIDEEVGAYEDGGLDFRSIETFDEWLLQGKNLDIVLPEPKGIVVLRPRRREKEYDNDYLNIVFNVANLNHTYILIRNGENVYRIFTEKLVIRDRLFPRRSEMGELVKKLEAADWDSDKAEDAMHQYTKRAMLMQGLIDRTDIFKPMPVDRLNIFKLDEHEGLVNFIYDDEASLPSGRLPFDKWLEEINSKIQHGSRVLLTGRYSGYGSRRDEYGDRFYMASNSYEGLKNVPDLPKEGVYEVERFRSSTANDYRETQYAQRLAEYRRDGVIFKDEGIVSGKTWRMPDDVTGSRKIYRIRVFSKDEDLTIMYKPDAEASAGWDRWETHERKVRARFKIRPDDDFVMNYDQISLDDIEFYLHSRVDRPNYLHMMPLLKKIKKHLLEEKALEEQFIRLVFDTTPKSCYTDEGHYLRIRAAVDWWKFKNQNKRAIRKDDTLALRMIKSKLTTQTKR